MGVLQTFQGIFDTARISVPTVLESVVGRPLDPAVAEQRLSWWSKHILESAEVSLTVEGREHAGDGSEPFIVMSNHQSLFDIPVLFQAIPGKLRMVAKAELFRALAHPARIRVLEVLAEGEHSVGEMQPLVGIESSHLSQQLAVLRRAGVVTTRKEGSTVFYALRAPELAELLAVAKRFLIVSLSESTELLAGLRAAP